MLNQITFGIFTSNKFDLGSFNVVGIVLRKNMVHPVDLV